MTPPPVSRLSKSKRELLRQLDMEREVSQKWMSRAEWWRELTHLALIHLEVLQPGARDKFVEEHFSGEVAK